MSATLDLTRELIRRASVTPEDAGCQALIGERLRALGFALETMSWNGVDNLWARRGTEAPLFVFAGHTDVVPPGPVESWRFDPFDPQIQDGELYGRGAADMKGSLAAMVTACERFLTQHPDHRGSLAFLLTSDEEGPAVDGTVRVIQRLVERGEAITWALVGEPSSDRRVGDVVKHGRRGSLGARLRVKGMQGHVAYPQLADNPIHRAAPALAELAAVQWDQGNADFPPTSLQISNLRAGTGATNVIPGVLEVDFNLRFSTEQSVEGLQAAIAALLDRHGLSYQLDWTVGGQPFLTPTGDLLEATRSAIESTTGRRPELSTAGGTSDGRFIAPTGAQVVELGPSNATIHQVDERVAVEDLDRLSSIYTAILERLLA